MPSSSLKVYDPYRSISGSELSGTLSPSHGTLSQAPSTRSPEVISTDGCSPPSLSRSPRNMYWDTTDAVAVHETLGAAVGAGPAPWANDADAPHTMAVRHASTCLFFIGFVLLSATSHER